MFGKPYLMLDLASFLCRVEKPGRYIGGEVGAVCKDHDAVDVRLALLFPDVYDIGMSHLGGQILYHVVNSLPWALAERAYAVWPDMDAEMRARDIPLFTLESRTPVRDFDAVGFSLQYELLCTNVLAMLDLAGIPLLSAERTDADPIVIAGGPGAANPEPMSDFIDLFFIGDGEESLPAFAELLRHTKGKARRDTIIEAARTIDGVYAPAFYDVQYNEDGTVHSVQATEAGLPDCVRAAKVADLDAAPFPTRPIVPFVEVVHDRVTMEIMRGCTRGCRFCQAGMARRPVRARSIERIVELARECARNTGHEEIALTSLSSSDYPNFRALLEAMNAMAEPLGLSLSLSSLRVSDQLNLLPGVLSNVRKSGLTIAPEAGTDRLRRVINKDVTNEDLLDGVRAAYAAGWRQVKLYFMIGLPTETPEDWTAIVELCNRVSLARKDVAGGAGKVNVSVSALVPKPHTPLQWDGMAPLDEILTAQRSIREQNRRRAVRYRFHDARTSRVEAAIARGDRRVGRVIRRVWSEGGVFQAWQEFFSYERWDSACRAEGLTLEFYAGRTRATDEVLPWDHISVGVEKEFLLCERERARSGVFTPDCREGHCTRCGACERHGRQG
jgi:radical SAM family uncharacterized protein